MDVLHRVEHFLRQSGMPRTRFGRLAANDPRLVDDLRRGREPRGQTVRRIDSLIRDYRP